MEHLLKGRFGSRIFISSFTHSPLKYGKNVAGKRHLHAVWMGRAADRARPLLKKQMLIHQSYRREYGMFVLRAVRGVLKIRYLLLGGAVTGGVTLQKKYQDWRDGLPDMKWLEDVMPNNEKWQSWRSSLIEMRDTVQDNVDLDPALKTLLEAKSGFQNWFDKRLNDAIAASEKPQNQLPPAADSVFNGLSDFVDRLYSDTKEEFKEKTVVHARPAATSDDMQKRYDSAQKRIEQLLDEIVQEQIKHNKTVERLEHDNRELRKQNLLLKGGSRSKMPQRKVEKSLIDLYSEVLDELADYDSSYQTQDHLPRVVVVGDQSSGKTSVLEMIAQARIFPRGAGEMMTRAPVKVTLAEGPYHIAQFKDSNREFDLSKESDLADLRKEVEIRMRRSVRAGKTVSSDVISMSVKGPGLQRMVLVDLPGIISTVTTDMAADTRESIKKMTQTYMSNPNAIILCIQDGSVDAERSNVTDIVSQCDPQGKRTIFVLTKVDMAEENLADPNRVRKILTGKLFPMRALGYFAVVTGRGRKDDSIQTIKEYEEQFFKSSKLFKQGQIMSSQMTTRNLSHAVADCFWKMVKESVENQAHAFKATRFNLETEWKNNFPRIRELDRDELYERAKSEILDEMVHLSSISAKEWEDAILNRIWNKVSKFVFEDIYLPAAQTGSYGTFNTTVDIKLRHWAEQALPASSVESGWEALQAQFQDFMKHAKKSPSYDEIFNDLKQAVIDEALSRHSWEEKAADMLSIIQLNTLEDRQISDKREWDCAVTFLETSIQEKLKDCEQTLKEQIGPSATERWLYWKYSTDEQKKRNYVKGEVDQILYSSPKHPPTLSYDELATVKQNLKTQKIEVDGDFIRDVWNTVYRRHFLKDALGRAFACRRGFYFHQQGIEQSGYECSDVVLFWRIQQVLKITANSLRQQVMNKEARRLDMEIKDVLEDFSQNDDLKANLLKGRRVELAEELKRVRRIQEKLDQFIKALIKEEKGV